MPNNFPTSPEPSSVKISSTAPTNVTYTQSLRRVASTIGAQVWSFNVSWPVMEWSDMAPIWAFVASLGGRATTFYFRDPSYQGPQGTVSAATTAAAGAVGDSDISVTLTGTLKAGDYLKFTGHDKVYMVTSDVATGTQDVPIFPTLQYAVNSSTAVKYAAADIKFVCALKDDTASIDVDTALHYGFALEIEEVVNT